MYDETQNLLNDAADIVHHLHAPNLRKLVVSVDSLDNSESFIGGCKAMVKVICDTAPDNLDSLELNIGELRVSQLPSSRIWPDMQDCIKTLLQFTKISRFASNLHFDIDEDALYTDFPNINNPPDTLQILGCIGAMLPSEKAFSRSIKQFIKSRRGKPECSININLSAGIMGDHDEVLDMRYNSETLERDANDDQACVQRPSIPPPKDIQGRIEYIMFDDNIVNLVMRMTHEL